MLLYLNLLLQILCMSGVSCAVGSLSSKPLKRQLFLSRHVVAGFEEFEGGVLVNESGIIEAVLNKESVDYMLRTQRLQVVDGGEWALLAGGVDSHVHVDAPSSLSLNGYVTATQAAAAGGITTIIDMTQNAVSMTSSLENLSSRVNTAKKQIFVDVGFWSGVIPGNADELNKLLKAGVIGFKCVLADNSVPESPYVSPDDLDEVLSLVNGTGTVLAFQTELENNKTSQCNDPSCRDSNLYKSSILSRSDEMELQGVSLIASHLNNTDVHVHFVHVSSARLVPILEAARETRLKNGYKGWRGGITEETCSHYLTLSSDQVIPGRSELNTVPPIGNEMNKQKLWEYIKENRLDLVTSDHSPIQQDLGVDNFYESWSGVSSIEHALSLFWTEAKARGHKLSTMSYYWSTAPARLIGLQERKGSIRVGLDADLIFFNPNSTFIMTSESISNVSPYLNRVFTGKVMKTYVRGHLVYSDGELIGKPKGKLLLNNMRSQAICVTTTLWKTLLYILFTYKIFL